MKEKQWEHRIKRLAFLMAMTIFLCGLFLAGMVVADYRIRSVSYGEMGVTVEDSIRAVLEIFDWQK